jgi:hypothetical protein
MDDRYLRFPRWIEASGLAGLVTRELSSSAWLLFRRLIEQDLYENLFPDWVVLQPDVLEDGLGINGEDIIRLTLELGKLNLLRVRQYGDSELPSYQYQIRQPLPVPHSEVDIQSQLDEWGLVDGPEQWRYWEREGEPTKYEKILRLYERTCGIKMSARIVEDLVELAETYPITHLEKAFDAARVEAVTNLGWVRKYLKRIKQDERLQKGWGRPRGLELPSGYSIPGDEEESRE